jgi:hypothetical protein
MSTGRIVASEVATPRIGRILGGDARLAQNDEPNPGELTAENVDAEVQRMEDAAVAADLHYNELKNSGELQRRRDAWGEAEAREETMRHAQALGMLR